MSTLFSVLLACTDSTQLPYVASVRLQPDSIHVSPGATAQFTATPVARNGEALPERAERIMWSVADPTVASISGPNSGATVTVSVHRVGTGHLLATLGRGEQTAQVFVQPAGLESIAIDPPQAEVELRSRPTFRARLLDASGSEISPDGFRISWAVTDEAVALPTNTSGPLLEVFARGTGETDVRLIVGGLSKTAHLVVR